MSRDNKIVNRQKHKNRAKKETMFLRSLQELERSKVPASINRTTDTVHCVQEYTGDTLCGHNDFDGSDYNIELPMNAITCQQCRPRMIKGYYKSNLLELGREKRRGDESSEDESGIELPPWINKDTLEFVEPNNLKEYRHYILYYEKKLIETIEIERSKDWSPPIVDEFEGHLKGIVAARRFTDHLDEDIEENNG